MGICDLPVISGVCETAGEAAASLVSAPFDWLAQAMGAAAGWLFEAVWNVFDATTLVDITSDGYLSVYNLLFGIAVFVMLLFFCLQLITGLIRRKPTALTRAALGLAKSVLGPFVVITLTGLLLEVVDQLCVGIVQAAGETTESMGEKITIPAGGLAGINIAAPGSGRSSRSSSLVLRSPLQRSCGSPRWSARPCCWSRSVCTPRLVGLLVGRHSGVAQQVGDVRGRADLFQARAGGDVPGRDHPGRRADRWGPVVDQ